MWASEMFHILIFCSLKYWKLHVKIFFLHNMYPVITFFDCIVGTFMPLVWQQDLAENNCFVYPSCRIFINKTNSDKMWQVILILPRKWLETLCNSRLKSYTSFLPSLLKIQQIWTDRLAWGFASFTKVVIVAEMF